MNSSLPGNGPLPLFGNSKNVLPGVSRIGAPVGIGEGERGESVRPGPRAEDHLAAGEHDDEAGAGGGSVGRPAVGGAGLVVEEGDDDVVRRDLGVVGEEMRLAGLRTEVLAARRVVAPLHEHLLDLQVEAGHRLAGGRRGAHGAVVVLLRRARCGRARRSSAAVRCRRASCADGCGSGRAPSPGPWPSVTSSMSESRSRAMLPGFPPEHANTARLNEPRRFTSCSRHDRIGPTKSRSRLCQTVAKRVGPAPQASKTMSASLSPVCGRAPGSLLTLTTSATLPSSAGSPSGRPVSGSTGGGSVVVGGDGRGRGLRRRRRRRRGRRRLRRRRGAGPGRRGRRLRRRGRRGRGAAAAGRHEDRPAGEGEHLPSRHRHVPRLGVLVRGIVGAFTVGVHSVCPVRDGQWGQSRPPPTQRSIGRGHRIAGHPRRAVIPQASHRGGHRRTEGVRQFDQLADAVRAPHDVEHDLVGTHGARRLDVVARPARSNPNTSGGRRRVARRTP